MITTKLTDREFFSSCLDFNVPEFKEIPALVEKDDLDAAKKFFADYIRAFFRSEEKFAARKTSLFPSFDSIRKEAERVKSHTLISCRVPYSFGEKIDWTLNPTYNGYKEWPWVLNRHHEWGHLADYYVVSGDESFAKEWADQFMSWAVQAQCPDDIVNNDRGSFCENACWRTLEAAIRIGGWRYYIEIFSQSPSVSDEVITVFFKSVWEHGNYLRKTRSERNFLLHEMGALAAIGFEYYFLKDSAAWLEYANSRLEEQVDVQVYPDGMHYEMTVHYHDNCLRKYLTVYNMYVNAGKTPPEYTLRALERMYGAYVKMARPDFFCPTMNDGEGVEADIALRNALEVFPEREDFRYFVTHRAEGKAPEYGSYFMDYSGIVAMRSDWSENAVWAYMDASPLGYGHHHDDRHNIQMYAYGHELLIEAGTFDYDTSEMRRYVTSCRGHNCSRIDGLEQNMRKSYKRVPGVTSVKSDTRWNSSETRDVAESDYTAGYGEDPLLYVDWTRKLIFLKNEAGLPPVFVVVDRFKANDEDSHDYELIWHMHDNPTTLLKNSVTNVYPDGVGVTVASSDGNISIARGVKSPVFQGWMPNYSGGDVEHYPTPTALNKGRFAGTRRIVTVLAPFENGESPIVSVEASSDFENKEFTLILKSGTRVSLSE